MNCPRKRAICDALAQFVRQRPGLEPRNYISHGNDAAGRRAYFAEQRAIGKDKQHAELLLLAVKGDDAITADMLIAAAQSAYSGRLSIREVDDPGMGPLDPARIVINYTVAGYWSVEYRRAACAVLASALWDHAREHGMPAPDAVDPGSDARLHGGVSAGTWLRDHFRREFGSAIQRRWFN
jgi:hypothetical protein